MTSGWFLVIATFGAFFSLAGLLTTWLFSTEPVPKEPQRPPAGQNGGRDQAREAFAKAIASGRSPGAAALLAELERGWERADKREGEQS